ncbi:NrdH-redoxin [Haematobacter missouriensis]|uniref:NrdH-redoxin n=1 Tax=Haematobacter missouriensis TaxID=366616 RepID=A0A212AJC5_9RHOB|nr:NrdH-redoxin [Haematobacter missouriensis]
MVVLYTTAGCQPCRATKRALQQKGIAYEEIDLTQDAAALDLVRSWGYQSAPVVYLGPDHHWYGYRPDLIAGLT